MHHKIDIFTWNNTRRPIGILLIIPGLGEDILQYDNFAKFLNKNRYNVIGISNPTTTPFATTSNNIRALICKIKSEYNLPVFVFGHGYGGFIARRLLMMTDLCSGAVCLSGVSKYPTIALRIARTMARFCKLIFGTSVCAPRYNNVRFTYEFYIDMINNIMNLSADVPSHIPLLIINRGRGLSGRLTRALYNNYGDSQLHNLTMILYPYGDKNLVLGAEGDDVMHDVVKFLNSVQK